MNNLLVTFLSFLVFCTFISTAKGIPGGGYAGGGGVPFWQKFIPKTTAAPVAPWAKWIKPKPTTPPPAPVWAKKPPMPMPPMGYPPMYPYPYPYAAPPPPAYPYPYPDPGMYPYGYQPDPSYWGQSDPSEETESSEEPPPPEKKKAKTLKKSKKPARATTMLNISQEIDGEGVETTTVAAPGELSQLAGLLNKLFEQIKSSTPSEETTTQIVEKEKAGNFEASADFLRTVLQSLLNKIPPSVGSI